MKKSRIIGLGLITLSLINIPSFAYAKTQYVYGVENAARLRGNANGDYVVLLGSFSQKANAQRLARNYNTKGLHAINISFNKGLYIVKLGPIHSAAKTRMIASELLGHRSKHRDPIQRKIVYPQARPKQTTQVIPVNYTAPIQTPIYQKQTFKQHQSSGYRKYFTPIATLSVGGFYSSLGKSQNIDIQGNITNQYTVTHTQNYNALVGLGYYVKTDDVNRFNMKMAYGINAYYLANTSVKGHVIQDDVYTNLSYQYNVTHFPVYIAAKAIFENATPYNMTLDAGVGPNFMIPSGYHEKSLSPYAVADKPFIGQSNATFSAMAGIGIRLKDAIAHLPLECGYRFYYLGQGSLTANSNQILDPLRTNNIYTNALLCTITT